MKSWPNYFLVISFSILFISCKNKPAQLMNKSIFLNNDWTFKMEGEEQEYPARVPGTVQTDLLFNNKLPQPFYRDNEKEYQWIDKKNWIYTNKFFLDSNTLSSDEVFLKFHGLDTYAEVYLNNKKILYANNFYRSWRVNVRDELVAGENILVVKFSSPINIGLQKLEELGFPLPAVNDQSEVGGLGDKKVSVFTRKAPYHYGWDWGPRFVTMGIWRPVELQFSNMAEICDVYIQQNIVSVEAADLTTEISLSVFKKGNYQLQLVNNTTGNTINKNVSLTEGQNLEKIEFKILNPKLWWPRGYGGQNIYEFTVRLFKDDVLIDESKHKTGLRTIEVVREEDEYGKSFYFRVNGVPVFAKGANYIPNDNFLPVVTPVNYREVVKSAAEANMNMLRVWGGGIYENEIFYDICDELGLLVWQDFMFACSMYPGNDEFLENVRLEAVENVTRLRNHPSIALWCGNNEIDAAWCQWGDENCGWGWKKRFTKEQREYIWHSYDTLFHKILPEVVNKLCPETFYWPSSPVADWGKSASYENNSGDMHYWGVWHGGDPFEKFDKLIPRFMSEYGFQSFPEFKTINEFTLPDDWNIYSDVMMSHQRSPIGNQKIKEYMELYYKVPDDFKDMLYVGQLLQAYAIKKAIDIHRINKSNCMGSLYWQLNDCWPGASWSGIDYYGNWKALNYRVKDAFKPIKLGIR
ncbi:MAG: glycoside hydrolase family 2 protein [Bacteroidales bacterium]|nr:glycoside hydrolase family 2 protein [Bacteroidales bacterium]MBN2820954.1 glycoside hydrolase family 2 protein [Bacteroidales bacterium]